MIADSIFPEPRKIRTYTGWGLGTDKGDILYPLMNKYR
jgi:hypothetical protein